MSAGPSGADASTKEPGALAEICMHFRGVTLQPKGHVLFLRFVPYVNTAASWYCSHWISPAYRFKKWSPWQLWQLLHLMCKWIKCTDTLEVWSYLVMSGREWGWAFRTWRLHWAATLGKVSRWQYITKGYSAEIFLNRASSTPNISAQNKNIQCQIMAPEKLSYWNAFTPCIQETSAQTPCSVIVEQQKQ